LLRVQEVKANDKENAILALEQDIDFFLHCALLFTRFSFDLPTGKTITHSLPKIFHRKK
jgi:hypothetical protein